MYYVLLVCYPPLLFCGLAVTLLSEYRPIRSVFWATSLPHVQALAMYYWKNFCSRNKVSPRLPPYFLLPVGQWQETIAIAAAGVTQPRELLLMRDRR